MDKRIKNTVQENIIDLTALDAKTARAINERLFGKGIALAAGFDLGAALPLDSRIVAATIEERNAHVTSNRAYEGMQVYVVETKKNYQLVGSEWIETGVTAEQLEAIHSAIDAAKSEVTALVEAEANRAKGEEGKIRTEFAAADSALKTTLEEAINAVDTKADSNKGLIDGLDTKIAQEITDRKAADSAQDTVIAGKAEKTYVDTELGKKADKSQLGTVASLNTGVAEGNVPVLGANGKLAESMMPSLAVNETFTVESPEEAMSQAVQVGDIVIINPASPATIAIVDKHKADVANAAQGFKTLSNGVLNEEFSAYLAEGKMTYICINAEAETFEEKFRPLQSAADTVSKAEFDKQLALKADKTQVATDIQSAKEFATSEAERAAGVVNSALETYKESNDTAVSDLEGRATALENTKLDKSVFDAEKLRVDAELGKKAVKTEVETALGLKLDKSAFDTEKERVDGELAKKADKTQVTSDIEAAKTELTESINGVDGKVTSLTSKVDGHVGDAVKHITAEERQAWNAKTDKFVAQIGDGVAVTFDITHNLNSEDVTVAVREVSTKQLVFTDVVCTDANNITVSFAKAPAENEFKVVVIG